MKWSGLDVGHRGSGNSFKGTSGGAIRENTIASLKKACESGADFVEFDVNFSQLTDLDRDSNSVGFKF